MLVEKKLMAYGQVKRACYCVRMELANAMHEHEDIAKEKVAWEDAHFECDVDAVRRYAAVSALEDYYEKQCYNITGEFAGAYLPVRPHNSLRKDLKFAFLEDTPEDTRHRLTALFSWSCVVYGPNTHAYANAEG